MPEEIKARKLSEIDSFCGEVISQSHPLFISAERRKAFLENPFLEDGADTICQWVGYYEGKVAGWNYSFPIHVKADGREYRSTTGSSLNVAEWARKSNLGLVLPAKGVEVTGKDGIAIAASCSQMAIPVHQINGYRFFKYPRFVVLWRSRSVVEMVCKSRCLKFWEATFSFIGDCLIGFYSLILKGLVCWKLRGVDFHVVDAENENELKQVADLIDVDTHRFTECHDIRWLKWHLTCSFSKDGPGKLILMVRRNDGCPLGFYMMKKRFYAQASHRGFKNVLLASFMEWAMRPEVCKLGKWMIAHAALSMRGEVDAVEFATAEKPLQIAARRFGWRQIGEANVGVKVMKNFPLFGDKDLKDVSCWRIRPAMGDNGLS